MGTTTRVCPGWRGCPPRLRPRGPRRVRVAAHNPPEAGPQTKALVSPHSGSTSDRENERLTELFCENLRRFLAGEPLLNVLNLETLY